ncbi:MAG: type II secretion system protein GspD [Bacteroidota bacterium]
MNSRALFVLALLACGLAQAETTRVVPLNFADARLIAACLGGVSRDGGYSRNAVEAFARDTIAMGLRRLPGGEGQWTWNAEARSYPESGGATLPMPEGLTQRPMAVPGQNALLLRGSTDALDRTEELIRMLDKPVKMVNIELKLVDQPEEAVEEWGLDFRGFGEGVAVGSVGNAPAAGIALRYGVGNLQALAGFDQRRSRGVNVTGANVTTFDNTPATVSFGETLPFFVSHISYDLWGNRHVETEPNFIFAGIELFVHPRITGDDTVTMRLSPTITEAAGAVMAPDGSSIPITKTLLTDTQVRVRDGESMVIGGFNRLSSSQMDRFSSLLGEKKISRTSNPMLIVTPHIIREQ